MKDDIVAVDVGGTFTDVCVLEGDTGALRVAKTPSTGDPIEGVMSAVEEAGVDLSRVALFSHATTVATNALITRRFPAAAMVTTKGFRDVIEIRRGTKDELWDAYYDVAPPPIRRRDRFEVTERIDYAGDVIEELDEEEARRVARLLARHEVATVAVCFINSYANPAHELRMREILEEELPDVRVSTSSEVLPEIFEHERFSTTVANAVLQPLVGRYVRALAGELEQHGYRGDLVILHSGGGVMTPETADRFAVRLAASGIAAGAIASRHIAGLCGFENAIGLDMGGTSTDISLVYGGEARTTNEWFVQYGYPIRFPSIEVLTIGAGGGSLAWLDDAGSLRNGPQSAGADPGPACYAKGGTEPTNTDANVVLGRLGTELIDGAMKLDPARAHDAIRTGVADPLGLEMTDAAEAVIAVANANMADAIRLISVRRGYDPREFVLVCFGGAGPLHGAALAAELSIPTVLVPPNPGATSALGCLLVDVRHDLFTMLLGTVDELDPDELEREFAQLEDEARERMRAEGVAEDAVELLRTIDMRYVGQWRSIAVPLDGRVESLDALVALFEDEHEREHSYRRPGSPVEIYRANLRATGVTRKAELARHELGGSMPEPVQRRRVHFPDAEGSVEAPIYRRDTLPAGVSFDGPAVVEQLDSTTLVPPGVRAEVDEYLNIRMTIDREAS
ncbi:hydantoinase/oxoprolinase family protein [Capillimicrobium parvum]|uniref:Acetophenone carboxylase gamma subunit n=1 Tax=Capillimicrobium parvum TaxID=2884022 RepID=A0A9E6XY53_9ACTN|nr:hydantoinase/oxoprolinase family protein [Capillimicrobium parvum]UGS35946.1 Acetophenone carboxylase gamma subunit [Capillimicrobium parvum]